MQKLLLCFLLTSTLLLFAAVLPTSAFARTATTNSTFMQTQPSVVYPTAFYSTLKHKTFDYFSPTYITCRVYQPCVTVRNGLARLVWLYQYVWGYRSLMLYPGVSASFTFRMPGTYSIGVRNGMMRVPLTVTVYGGWQGYNRW